MTSISLRLCVATAAVVATAMAPTLVDHPIESTGGVPVYLDGAGWTAMRNPAPKKAADVSLSTAYQPLPSVTIPATVPGDILTDLQRAGEIPDPYFDSSWRKPDFIEAWNQGTWTYKKSFRTHVATPAAVAAGDEGSATRLLVFDGIRMGAIIRLNGKFLGNASNQFQRYVFSLATSDLAAVGAAGSNNTLEITFGAELGIPLGGRYTYSSEIDWAPDMLTKDKTSCDNRGCRSTFGFGIWKSVYLVSVPKGSAAITQFVPHTFYAGGHPTAILTDESHKGFAIKAEVDLFAPVATGGTVVVTGAWPGATPVSREVSLTAGQNSVAVLIPAEQATSGVRLWHPHGHGGQPMYNITATFETATGDALTTRRLGFRHVALVTVNDTDPAVVATNGKGTGELTMFFRVNGAAVYARGGNKVPMDLIDGRMSAEAHYQLVKSAAEGNMNMLRAWGGGIWEPRAFYDACDDFGILLYTDMQFEQNVRGTPKETTEMEYQIKRLSHHPSVAMWDGCNECDGHSLTESFVMPAVAHFDKSRPIWPSCPASGWVSGVDTLSSRPNGDTLVTAAGSGDVTPPRGFPWPQESHGPYVRRPRYPSIYYTRHPSIACAKVRGITT